MKQASAKYLLQLALSKPSLSVAKNLERICLNRPTILLINTLLANVLINKIVPMI